ncbi:MAG: hypothetical protein KBC91_07545, partial [Candidatus Omnitrophica bacterium]|nr:hypothetical protein [Candidatus Omnitrophota bacterium]
DGKLIFEGTPENFYLGYFMNSDGVGRLVTAKKGSQGGHDVFINGAPALELKDVMREADLASLRSFLRVVVDSDGEPHLYLLDSERNKIYRDRNSISEASVKPLAYYWPLENSSAQFVDYFASVPPAQGLLTFYHNGKPSASGLRRESLTNSLDASHLGNKQLLHRFLDLNKSEHTVFAIEKEEDRWGVYLDGKPLIENVQALFLAALTPHVNDDGTIDVFYVVADDKGGNFNFSIYQNDKPYDGVQFSGGPMKNSHIFRDSKGKPQLVFLERPMFWDTVSKATLDLGAGTSYQVFKSELFSTERESDTKAEEKSTDLSPAAPYILTDDPGLVDARFKVPEETKDVTPFFELDVTQERPTESATPIFETLLYRVSYGAGDLLIVETPTTEKMYYETVPLLTAYQKDQYSLLVPLANQPIRANPKTYSMLSQIEFSRDSHGNARLSQKIDGQSVHAGSLAHFLGLRIRDDGSEAGRPEFYLDVLNTQYNRNGLARFFDGFKPAQGDKTPKQPWNYDDLPQDKRPVWTPLGDKAEFMSLVPELGLIVDLPSAKFVIRLVSGKATGVALKNSDSNDSLANLPDLLAELQTLKEEVLRYGIEKKDPRAPILKDKTWRIQTIVTQLLKQFGPEIFVPISDNAPLKIGDLFASQEEIQREKPVKELHLIREPMRMRGASAETYAYDLSQIGLQSYLINPRLQDEESEGWFPVYGLLSFDKIRELAGALKTTPESTPAVPVLITELKDGSLDVTALMTYRDLDMLAVDRATNEILASGRYEGERSLMMNTGNQTGPTAGDDQDEKLEIQPAGQVSGKPMIEIFRTTVPKHTLTALIIAETDSGENGSIFRLKAKAVTRDPREISLTPKTDSWLARTYAGKSRTVSFKPEDIVSVVTAQDASNGKRRVVMRVTAWDEKAMKAFVAEAKRQHPGSVVEFDSDKDSGLFVAALPMLSLTIQKGKIMQLESGGVQVEGKEEKGQGEKEDVGGNTGESSNSQQGASPQNVAATRTRSVFEVPPGAISLDRTRTLKQDYKDSESASSALAADFSGTAIVNQNPDRDMIMMGSLLKDEDRKAILFRFKWSDDWLEVNARLWHDSRSFVSMSLSDSIKGSGFPVFFLSFIDERRNGGAPIPETKDLS